MAAKPRPRRNEGKRSELLSGAPVILDAVKFQLICERRAETGLARASCEDLGFEYVTVMNAIAAQRAKGDDSWGEAWFEAHEKFKESLEREIFKRGRDGTPVRWAYDKKTGLPMLDAQGNKVVLEVQYSDRMLELAAKGHFPERYRERIAVSGQIGLEPVDAFANLSVRAKREIRAIVIRDLEEQRELAAGRGEAVDVGVAMAIEDMRGDDA